MTILSKIKKYDIVLANIPRTDPRAPYLGTFLLKSVVQNNGFTCKSFDWNRDLYEKTKDNIIFSRGDLDFNLKGHFEKLWNNELKEICLGWIKELEECNPKWFGITFLSQRQEHVGRRILEIVRNKLPAIKIMVGGYFVGHQEDVPENVLGNILLKEGLIDYYVNGQGEDAIINLLNGNYKFQGINTVQEITVAPDINLNPTPDFSDVSHYKYLKYYTYSSRGCVNRCGFCTEHKYSRRFTFRKAELVLRDMLHVQKTIGNNDFFVVDSLINGSRKEFRKLISLLDGKGVRWEGQYLCNDWMSREDYKLAARAGLKNLSIGVESGSERIRNEMGKGFSNKELYQTIEYATENGIYVTLMFIVGWTTESEEDFIETLDLLTKISKYKNIREINPGITLRLDWKMKVSRQYNIGRDSDGKWVYKDNTYAIRQERWNRFVEHCKMVGLNVSEKHREKVEENYLDIK